MKKPHLFVRVLILSLTLLCLAGVAVADVRLPAIIADGMVLQQEIPVTIWGWAEQGEKITVTIGQCSSSTVADSQGRWSTKLEAMEAGGRPRRMTVAGKNTITVRNILVGEVWICSGQSNMQWTVSNSDNSEEEIAAADYPEIRLFTVPQRTAPEPQDDCIGRWSACSSETVAGFSAVGYFFGRSLHKKLDVPVGLINTSWGGSIAEAWTSREELEKEEDFRPILERSATFDPNPKQKNQASVLFNGMINPLIPVGIRGAIWYQGESNCGRAEQYQKLFPVMITDWRTRLGLGDFPFLYVQLAPFRYTNNDPAACAELREAQRLTLSLSNTGMAVTTDIGNVSNIHPTNKQEVGRRLALWALAKTYGESLVYSGPLYDSMNVEGGKIRVSFTNTGAGLVAKDGALADFTIASADRNFMPAVATIDGNTVLVHSLDVAKPVAVRFGWRDDAEPNLFNAEGLPASPFRTDNFKLITAGAK